MTQINNVRIAAVLSGFQMVAATRMSGVVATDATGTLTVDGKTMTLVVFEKTLAAKPDLAGLADGPVDLYGIVEAVDGVETFKAFDLGANADSAENVARREAAASRAADPAIAEIVTNGTLAAKVAIAPKATPKATPKAAPKAAPAAAGSAPTTEAKAAAMTPRIAVILSARRKPGAEDRIIGKLHTATATGEKDVGFSSRAEGAGEAILAMVGQKVSVASRYTGPGVLFVDGVQLAA